MEDVFLFYPTAENEAGAECMQNSQRFRCARLPSALPSRSEIEHRSSSFGVHYMRQFHNGNQRMQILRSI